MVEKANDAKMADTMDNFGPCRSETKETKRNKSSDEDSCGHEENEFKMSVTVSKDWIDALKSQNDPNYDCADVLVKIVSEAIDRNRYNVRITLSEGTWCLDGCFSCIKEIRKTLQNEIGKKQRELENSGKHSDENDMDLGNDQQSLQENDGMGRTDLNDKKPGALMDSSTLGEVEEEPRKGDKVSGARSREKEENLKCPQLEEENRSMLKSCDEKLNPNAEKNNKRERKLINNSPEKKISQNDGKGIQNIGGTGGGRQLATEYSSRNGKYSENEKQKSTGQLYPALPISWENQGIQRDLTKASHGANKSFQNESRGVTSSDYPERRHESYKDRTPRDLPCPDDQKHRINGPLLSTSQTSEYGENLKDTSKFTGSASTSGPQEKKTNDPEHDRICALMLLPSIYIDEDTFNYLVQCRNFEYFGISKKFDVFEKYYKVGEGHRLAYEIKPQYDSNSVIAEFRALANKTNVLHANIDLPKEADLESLRSLVVTMDEFKDVHTSFMSIHGTRVAKIVGPYKEMDRARKMLTDVVASIKSTSHRMNTTVEKRSGFNVQQPTTSPHNIPTVGVQLYSAVAAINVVQPRTSIFTILNQTSDSIILSALNSLTIEVKRDELTKVQDVDVVVSCITNYLDPDGPLSDKIVRAAGPNVRTELDAHKFHFNFFHTGQLLHTSAGNLKAVKSIIHVVRPQTVEFPIYDPRSKDILRQVFANCFLYTNDRLRMKSICLPAIGSSLYGAEMVVDCFLDAVQMLAATVVNPPPATQHHPQHLNLIQLVTNDYICIGKLIDCITRRVRVWQVSEV